MKKKIALFTILFGLTTASVHANSIVTLTADVDGAIQSTGILGLSTVANANNIQTHMSGGNNVRHAVYEFDVSSLAGQTINGATLQVTTSSLISNTGTTAPVTFHGFTGDGAITDADFGLSATQVASETFAAGAGNSPAAGTILSIPLTDLAPLQAAINDTGSDHFGVRSETVNFVTFQIHSLENTGGHQPPTLLVNVDMIPEPTTWALLGLGGLALTLARRRKN